MSLENKFLTLLNFYKKHRWSGGALIILLSLASAFLPKSIKLLSLPLDFFLGLLIYFAMLSQFMPEEKLSLFFEDNFWFFLSICVLPFLGSAFSFLINFSFFLLYFLMKLVMAMAGY